MLLLMPLPNLMAQHQPASDAIYNSPTEGVIDLKFIPEKQMMEGMLQMVAKFAPYLVRNFRDEGLVNNQKIPVGGFMSQRAMTSDEDGIRSTSDLGLACAFLYKYGKANNITLPDSISYDKIYDMARKSLVFVYSTHRSNCLFRCTDNNYWGSSWGKFIQFESGLWAMGMAYQAYFLWDTLSDKEKECVRQVLESECLAVTSLPVVCNMPSNTMAEENGWDACVLAAYVGLFPDHKLSQIFFKKLRQKAVNVLSHKSDAKNKTVIDPLIDTMRVYDFHVGDNLFKDYTLQNHGYFHPGYQNVAIQELGEAALALYLFQSDLYGKVSYSTNALFHNCQVVQDSVLNYLVLPDGELSMPNGNDWSLFLYDQIAAYSTLACFLKNPDALMLENQAYKLIRARQETTIDGSWLLRPDVNQRRMGVQAHRVIMAYLMHHILSTDQLRPTRWSDLMNRVYNTKLFDCQNFIRAWSKDRFVALSLTPSLMYGGYFTPNRPDANKIVVPFSRYSTNSMMGYYLLRNGAVGARFNSAPKYQISGNSFVADADFLICSNNMERNFTIYCTPGNSVITLDMVRNGKNEHQFQEQNAAMLGISFDPFTNINRTFHYDGGVSLLSDTSSWIRSTPWLNIDNQIGIVNCSQNPNMRLGACYNNSSINTRLLSAQYNNKSKKLNAGEMAFATSVVYLCGVSASDTRRFSQESLSLTEYLPKGWMGIVARDSYGTYVLVSNLFGEQRSARLKNLPYQNTEYFPVLGSSMEFADTVINARITTGQYRSQGFKAGFFVKGSNFRVDSESGGGIRISAGMDTRVGVAHQNPKNGKLVQAKTFKISKSKSRAFIWTGSRIKALDIR